VIVLDTTVLVYAVGDDHELREPARTIVEAVESGTVQATTTVEAIQEFVHIRARRRDRADAAVLGRAYVTLLSPLLRPGEEDLVGGLRLFERQDALGTFDAVLAASAIAARAEALISADRSFDGVRGLRWVYLSGDEVAALLAG
jgi:predicted nucleic acid-binding protein